MSQCDGDQRRTFVFLNNLAGRTLDPVLPTSSFDDELAFRFSDFFSEKIIHIRREIDASVVNQEFSVDFPLRFTRSFTFSHFRLVTEADVLRYIRETRKTYCSLDPINVSKLGEAYESAAPAVGTIINSSFDEGHFVATEKRDLTLSAALDAVCVHCRDSVTALWTQTTSTENIFLKYSW